MKTELTCNYCNHKWIILAANKNQIEAQYCPKCIDTSITVRDANRSKIDTYEGAPPFEDENKGIEIGLDQWDKIFGRGSM